jgi:DNA gyrase/topoisomerase IV subunit A
MQSVCKAHLKSNPGDAKVCASCYRQRVVDAKGSFLKGEKRRIEQVQHQFYEQNEEREMRLRKNRELDAGIAKLNEAIRKHTAELEEDRRKVEERILRERERNSKVKSQVTNLKLAFEDAKKSETMAIQRRSEAEGQVMLRTNDLSFEKSQAGKSTIKLAKLTTGSRDVVHCRQFMLMGCRGCKRKFTERFREAMIKSNISFDNFSFASIKSSISLKRASVAESEQESCKCTLM